MSYRFTQEARYLLRQIARRLGLSQTSVMEMLLREKAESLNIPRKFDKDEPLQSQ